MALSSTNALNQIAQALAGANSRIVIDKSSLANAVAGQLFSLWRTTGQPAQAAIPGTTPAVPTNATTGAIQFDQQTAPVTSYLAWLTLQNANNSQTIEVWDRIAHMGGLVLNVTTSQAITGLDLDPTGLNPAAARLGASNYSDGQWFLEVYADGGGTASNATINVTYNDATSGNLSVVAVGGTLRAGRMIPLTPLIPGADQGKFIRRINSVILSASTTVAGNFGFTYARQRTVLDLPLANKSETRDWAALGCSEIPNGSCLMLVCVTTQTSTGALRGQGKIIHA
jgi:hypothetical protein